MMNLTREEIENEDDYTKLKDIGRQFRDDGKVLALNVTEEELKQRLLEIFDKNYAEQDLEIIAEENKEDAVVVDESTELGEDEVESEPEPDVIEIEEEEVAPAEEVIEEAVETITEEPEVDAVVEEAIAEAEEVEEIEPEVDAPDLYIAERDYKDWASGWGFNPKFDQPKPLPDELTDGLKNALKLGRIVKV